MSCSTDVAEMFTNGEWLDAVICWLTAGGDPTLSVVMPTAVYGIILLSLYVVGQSLIIPVVLSLLLGGVIFAAFPANALTLIVMAVMFTLSVGATVATWRLGQ